MNIKSSLGVYCSHREDINGPIKEAVDISNNKEYLAWLEKSIINPDRFDFPTTIVIRIKMEDRYYKGTLLDVKRVSEMDENTILSENEHRPEKWIKIDRENYEDFESILYIHGLEEISQPKEVQDIHPPQRPIYIKFLLR